MFISEGLTVNDNGNLQIGGCDCIELAKEYGTPLYVMDESQIRKNCKIYKDSINKYYDNNGLVLYASKAFCTTYMCKIVAEEGLGIDVVSGGELYTALKAGFPVEKIYFHGNNKSYDELVMAVENNVGRIVVDSMFELENLNNIASKYDKIVKILFRIKPGVEAHTHDFIQTGQIDSKFGVALETGEAMEIVEAAINLSNIDLVGVHCHIGSQIFDIDPFEAAAKLMMGFIGDIKDKFGLEIKELNLGGGFGIKYIPGDDPIEYDSYIEIVSKTVKDIALQRGIKLPFILMEPGRSIVAPAGITLYTVGAVKDIPNVRKYVSVDGGMGDNPRYILYQAEYDAVLANKPMAEKVEKITIAGKCCESGDILAKDIMMPKINPGDYLAILATGGYNYSMSSNYNRLPRPPVVMVKDGKSKIIVKRETYEDIVRNDII